MKKIIKKRYYEVIRVLVVDDRPVTNINFKAIFFFLLMAFLMNISMSFGIEMLGDFPNTILRRQLLIGLLIYSGLSLLMFFLFQRFSESKIIQLFPTFSGFYFSFQTTLLISSFWSNFRKVFGIFLIIYILFYIITFIYQIAIIEKIKHADWNTKNNTLFLPISIVCVIAAGLVVVTRLFDLSGYLVLIGIELPNIAISQILVYGYNQVFPKYKEDIE